MIPRFGSDPEEFPDLDVRAGKTHSGEIRSIRRRIPWRMERPQFVSPMETGPYDLTRHSTHAPGGRVLVVGRPQTATDIQTVTGPRARTVYTRGAHFPSVTAHDGTRIAYAASWFGIGDYSPYQARVCWEWLEIQLQNAWRDDGVRLLMTPATTGRDLWARTIDSHGWPVMSPEMQSIIRATGGQGRMETFGRDDSPPFTTLYEYDARMAYVALLDEMPIGTPEYLTAGPAETWHRLSPYAEGRFDVTWRAPDGWAHPGILPAHADDTAAVDWCWPLNGRGWVGGAELYAAEQAGWHVTIHAAWAWTGPKRSPLRPWRHRLLKVLDIAQNPGNGLDRTERAMIRAAIRGLILHTVGAFYGAPHWTTHTGENPPPEARRIRALPNGLLSWEQPEPPAWPAMIHPEWTVTVWSRARARLVSGHRGLTGMLTVDPSTLVAFRTDAVYTTAPTGWEQTDDGSPGRYRVKTYLYPSAQPWPDNGPALLGLRERAS